MKIPPKNVWARALLLALFCIPLPTEASKNCFVAKEEGKILKQVGPSRERHSPFSTFKIPLALIGFDAEILGTANTPEVAFTPEIEAAIQPWYHPEKYPVMLLWSQPQTPATWITRSVIWYSHYITQKLGMEKFKNYIHQLAYGNEDVSGTPGKNDGLLQSWLQSSLQISPLEQVDFLEKLSQRSLPLSKDAQEKTIEILKLENLGDDWVLYGKTGGGKAMGWFVGWIEKGPRRIVFAQYIEQPEDSVQGGGKAAKALAREALLGILTTPQKS